MKLIKIILISSATLLAIFLTIFFLIEDKPYEYFDPKNSDNIYTITADNNYFYINFDSNNSDNQKGFTGIIASSPTDLHQFLDKKVKINGKFIFTSPDKVLCPKENCKRNSNLYTQNRLQALEITDIYLAE